MAAPLGFKTFNTGDVLSAADTNGYLMQGVLVFADAAARSAAITSPQEGQTSYLKDTDVIQVYSGSAWVTKSGGSSPLTTKGDLYTYSTTDARLPVGTNGHTLVADSAEATGLKWAAPAGGGGMTLINTGGTALSGASTTVSTIPGTYNDLIIYVVDFYASSNFGPYLLINGDSTAANYQQFVARGAGSTNATYVDNATAGMDLTGYAVVNADNNNFASIYIPNYANTVSRKMANSLAGYQANTTPSPSKGVTNNTTNYLGSTLNITSLEFKTTVGTWSGGTVYVYGVK